MWCVGLHLLVDEKTPPLQVFTSCFVTEKDTLSHSTYEHCFAIRAEDDCNTALTAANRSFWLVQLAMQLTRRSVGV